MLRFIVSETGMWSLAKALSQSRPNQPVDKQNDLLSASFRECLVTPFQREFTLSARDCKVRWPENKCLKTSGSSQSAFECVCVSKHERVCLSSRVWEIMKQNTGQNQRSAQEDDLLVWKTKRVRKKEEWVKKVKFHAMQGAQRGGGLSFFGETSPALTVWLRWGGVVKLKYSEKTLTKDRVQVGRRSLPQTQRYCNYCQRVEHTALKYTTSSHHRCLNEIFTPSSLP